MIDGNRLVIRFNVPGCSFLTEGRPTNAKACGKKADRMFVQTWSNASGHPVIEPKLFQLCDEHQMKPGTMPKYFREFDPARDEVLLLERTAEESGQ